MKVSEDKKIRRFHRIIREQIILRDYPWRFVNDPYKVLVSEFMLHRTQANQVAPIYKEFIEKYPKIENFIVEDNYFIFDQLKTLGLYWRIHGLISAINLLYDRYQMVPLDYEALIDIKGIGPYIAGAVVCFSGNQPVPLMDTNTVRVVGRVFNLNLKGEARRRKEVKKTIADTTPCRNPRRYYYSVIDLAHNICHVNNPECDVCPLNPLCIYFSKTFF